MHRHESELSVQSLLLAAEAGPYKRSLTVTRDVMLLTVLSTLALYIKYSNLPEHDLSACSWSQRQAQYH